MNSRSGSAAAGVSPQTSDLFRLLLETVKDYAIFIISPEGYVLTWNPGAEALYGCKQGEIIGQHFSRFYLPEDVQSGWPMRELALADKQGRFLDEGLRVRKDGSSFWASITITALRDSTGKLCGFAKITKDVTERREASERINKLNRELQKLSAEILHVQDEERRRIARELHDDLGQNLSALKMIVSRTKNEEAIELADSALASVRSLSHLLHPPLLDETGLRAALDYYIEGLAKRSGIQITLTIHPEAFPRLSRDIETTIFRVVQESLTNVVRHASTERAAIEIDKQSDWLFVRIRDYGTGLPAPVIAPTGLHKIGVGIAGMRERIRQFDGELTVSRSEPGTLVEAKIPLLPASQSL
jgi:PAS domain S-box-containing protein